MTARILVVDDIEANRKLLKTRLMSEYFEVMTARNGQEALEICARERADIVLLDVMMPGLNGFEVCQRLKSDPKTYHIPVVMVTALDQPSDKVYGLQAGADDFLTKPVDDVALITRVKNLTRLKRLNDELLARVASSDQLGLGETIARLSNSPGTGGRVLLVEDHPRAAKRMVDTLAAEQYVDVEIDPSQVAARLAQTAYDLLIVSLDLERADGLRLCSQVRSNEATRNLPILIISDDSDNSRLLRGLDMGVNDYVKRPIDRNELLVRVRSQIKHKRFSDQLRETLQTSVDLALTDPLTGLHNRRFFENHFDINFEQSKKQGKPFALMVLDIDHFKSVNDTYGHDIGDAVLKVFAQRLKKFTRESDFSCRFGGEEFVLLMPNTTLEEGFLMAERLRLKIAEEPFDVGLPQGPLPITASVGVAAYEEPSDTRESILKRADTALYRAKQEGRNRIAAGMLMAKTA